MNANPRGFLVAGVEAGHILGLACIPLSFRGDSLGLGLAGLDLDTWIRWWSYGCCYPLRGAPLLLVPARSNWHPLPLNLDHPWNYE